MNTLLPQPDPMEWIGRAERVSDFVSPRHVSALRSVLDHEDFIDVGHSLPQCGQWTLAPAIASSNDTGVDGHIRLGLFLPPIALPRRMWAASKVQFHRPIHVGMAIERNSVVKSIKDKTGSTGALVFVEVEHSYRSNAELLVNETQTIVYREAQASGRPAIPAISVASDWTMRRSMTPDPVMLFRYSALTYNGHRIHYDQPYATQVEGYAGLVVHGPLLATLLADLVARTHGPDCIRSYSFRGQSPAFSGETVQLLGKTFGDTISLSALGQDSRVLMTAEATL